MKYDFLTYSLSMGTMTIYGHIGDECYSIAEIEVTDRDIDDEEDRDYLQNLMEEVANELNI